MSSKVKTQIICPDLKSCKETVSAIKNILVPYDDSAFSQRAFAFALDLANHYGSTLTTLTIMYQSPTDELGIKHETTVDAYKVKKLERSFKMLKEAAAKFYISVKNDMTVRNDVLESILSYIVSQKIDLVVVGSRSRIGSDRYTIGSIALGLCKSARCPVFIIK